MIFGWIAAAAVALGAGGVYLKVSLQKSAEKAAEDAHIAEVKSVVEHIKSFDVTQPGPAQEMLDYATQQKDLWTGEPSEVDVASLEARAKNTIETEKERTELLDKFASIQKDLDDATKQTPDNLDDVKRRLDEMEIKASMLGPDFGKQLAASHDRAEHAFTEALLADAKAAAAGGVENERAGLVKYARAEGRDAQDARGRAPGQGQRGRAVVSRSATSAASRSPTRCARTSSRRTS